MCTCFYHFLTLTVYTCTSSPSSTSLTHTPLACSDHTISFSCLPLLSGDGAVLPDWGSVSTVHDGLQGNEVLTDVCTVMGPLSLPIQGTCMHTCTCTCMLSSSLITTLYLVTNVHVHVHVPDMRDCSVW